MQPFLVIQCLTEHVTTLLHYGIFAFADQKHFKHYTEIRVFGYTEYKPHFLPIPNIPYAIIKDGLVAEAYFLNPDGLLISTRATQSLMQAKNINWRVQKERMKVLNLLKITG